MGKTSYHHGDLRNALISAGETLLTTNGSEGLSLRKVAAYAGVSHAAPYAHFKDKEALLAEISTLGFIELSSKFEEIVEAHKGDYRITALELANAYLEFAVEQPARFKLMFSDVNIDESKYPDLAEAVCHTYEIFRKEVEAAQKADFIGAGPADTIALSLWGLVHGLTSLYLTGQSSSLPVLHDAPKDFLHEALSNFYHAPLKD